MTTAPAPPVICDRSDCPAAAQRLIMIHGQDFHFCGHHTVELLHTLPAHASRTSTITTERPDPPPTPVGTDPTLVLDQAR